MLTHEEHVQQLAHEHEIVVERADDHYYARPRERCVWIPTDLSTDDAYLTALHEIGHVVMDEYVTESVWHSEFVAWGWAFLVALDVDPLAARDTWPHFRSYLNGRDIRYQMPAPTFAHHE